MPPISNAQACGGEVFALAVLLVAVKLDLEVENVYSLEESRPVAFQFVFKVAHMIGYLNNVKMVESCDFLANLVY